jgi:hypothetical protein
MKKTKLFVLNELLFKTTKSVVGDEKARILLFFSLSTKMAIYVVARLIVVASYFYF